MFLIFSHRFRDGWQVIFKPSIDDESCFKFLEKFIKRLNFGKK